MLLIRYLFFALYIELVRIWTDHLMKFRKLSKRQCAEFSIMAVRDRRVAHVRTQESSYCSTLYHAKYVLYKVGFPIWIRLADTLGLSYP